MGQMTQPTVSKQSHQVHTLLQYYNTYAVQQKTQTKINLCIMKWAKCNKTQSRKL